MEIKRNYVINFCCALLALILLICGAGVFFTNVKAPKAAQALESMDITKTEPLEYYTAEFLIVDIYSYYGDSIQRSTEYFCYALVKDKYNNTQAVSLSITDKDSLFMAVKGYACNEQAEIGDLIIECAAKAQKISAYPDYINRWYSESGATYNEMIGISTSIPMNFEFFSESDDFIETRKADQKAMLMIAMICTLIGAVFAFAAFLIPGIKVNTAPRLTAISSDSESEKTAETTEDNE
jgi:hypothetical protein